MNSGIFAYNKRPFFANLAFLIAFLAFSFFLVLTGPIYLIWAGILFSVEMAMLLILGISPFATNHEISGRELIIRQGWYFKSMISIDEIEKVSLMQKGPSRTGVFFKVFESTVYVTTQKNDLIILQLKNMKRFGWILGKKADRMVFDVVEQTRFLRMMEKSGASTPSNQAQGS